MLCFWICCLLHVLLATGASEKVPLTGRLSTTIDQDSGELSACSWLQHSASTAKTVALTARQVSEAEVDWWQDEWGWNFCTIPEANFERCCAKFETNAHSNDEINHAILILLPKAASETVRVSMNLWLHCRHKIQPGHYFRKYHFAHSSTVDDSEAQNWMLDTSIFQEYQCAKDSVHRNDHFLHKKQKCTLLLFHTSFYSFLHFCL